MKKQGLKRFRSLSRAKSEETPMDVDTKFQTKKVKVSRDKSGMRDEKQVTTYIT